jgi:hypothetical protein
MRTKIAILEAKSLSALFCNRGPYYSFTLTLQLLLTISRPLLRELQIVLRSSLLFNLSGCFTKFLDFIFF